MPAGPPWPAPDTAPLPDPIVLAFASYVSVAASSSTHSLSHLTLAFNRVVGEPARALAAAALGSLALESLSGVPLAALRAGTLTKLELAGKGLGVTEALVRLISSDLPDLP